MLVDFLKEIEDHRDLQARQYQLWEVLLISVCAVLGNSKTYTDIKRFADIHFELLKKTFDFKWKKVPDHTTIRQILIGIPIENLENAFTVIFCCQKRKSSNFVSMARRSAEASKALL